MLSPDTVVHRDTLWLPEDVSPNVGTRLQLMRQAMGLSLRKMSELLGHKQVSDLRGWESGNIEPHLETLLEIAAKVGVNAGWLVKGLREALKTPTQAAKLRALRAHRGLSRPALAMKADPEHFMTLRSQISRAELEDGPLRGVPLVMTARALDVPVEWLSAPGGFKEPETGPVKLDLHATLPAGVRALIQQITDLALMDQFSNNDAAALSKALTSRACLRLSGKDLSKTPLLFGANIDHRGRPVAH